MTSRDQRAQELGLPAEAPSGEYLNQCRRSGQHYFTSGHTSEIKGCLGDDLTVEDGRRAAVQSILRLLRSVQAAHGTLEGLRVVRLLACVRSTPDFVDHAGVINAASDLIHDLFGPEDGYHARSALGFASLPGGAAVEIEAVVEIG